MNNLLQSVSEKALNESSSDSSDVPFNLKMTLGHSLELLPYANRNNLELSLNKNMMATMMGKQGSFDNVNNLSTLPLDSNNRRETIRLVGDGVKLRIGREKELEDLSQMSNADSQSVKSGGSHDSCKNINFKSAERPASNLTPRGPAIESDSMSERSDLSWGDDAISLTESEALLELNHLDSSNGPTAAAALQSSDNSQQLLAQSTMIQMPHESKIKSQNTMILLSDSFKKADTKKKLEFRPPYADLAADDGQDLKDSTVEFINGGNRQDASNESTEKQNQPLLKKKTGSEHRKRVYKYYPDLV